MCIVIFMFMFSIYIVCEVNSHWNRKWTKLNFLFLQNMLNKKLTKENICGRPWLVCWEFIPNPKKHITKSWLLLYFFFFIIKSSQKKKICIYIYICIFFHNIHFKINLTYYRLTNLTTPFNLDIYMMTKHNTKTSGDFLKLNSNEWTLSFDFFFLLSRQYIWRWDCAIASSLVLVRIHCMMEIGECGCFL